MLRALTLFALLAFGPANAETIFKDGFEQMSVLTRVPLTLRPPNIPPFTYPFNFTFNPVNIPINAISLVEANLFYTIVLVGNIGDPTIYTITWSATVTSQNPNAGVSGFHAGVKNLNIGQALSSQTDLPIDSTSFDILSTTRINTVISIDNITPSPPPHYHIRIVSISMFFTFNALPDYRMTGSSSATANQTDMINIAPRLGELQGSSRANVVVNLGGGRRSTNFRAESGTHFVVPRSAPSMQVLAQSGTIMQANLRALHQASFSASSGSVFTLPNEFGIGASVAMAGSSSATADVRALRRLSASFEASSSATGSTVRIASVTGIAQSGTVMQSGLSAAQQFLVSFTANSESQWDPAINIMAPFTMVGSSSATGTTVSLYQGPADFNLDSTEGWSMDINASEWSIWH